MGGFINLDRIEQTLDQFKDISLGIKHSVAKLSKKWGNIDKIYLDKFSNHILVLAKIELNLFFSPLILKITHVLPHIAILKYT